MTIPPNTSAIVGIPKRAIHGRLIDRVEVAGKTGWADGRHQGEAPGIKAEGEDVRHIRFAFAAGSFRFLARTWKGRHGKDPLTILVAILVAIFVGPES